MMKRTNAKFWIFVFIVIIISSVFIIDYFSADVVTGTGHVVDKKYESRSSTDNEGNTSTTEYYYVSILDSEGFIIKFDSSDMYYNVLANMDIRFKYRKGKFSNYLIEWSFK